MGPILSLSQQTLSTSARACQQMYAMIACSLQSGYIFLGFGHPAKNNECNYSLVAWCIYIFLRFLNSFYSQVHLRRYLMKTWIYSKVYTITKHLIASYLQMSEPNLQSRSFGWWSFKLSCKLLLEKSDRQAPLRLTLNDCDNPWSASLKALISLPDLTSLPNPNSSYPPLPRGQAPLRLTLNGCDNPWSASLKALIRFPDLFLASKRKACWWISRSSPNCFIKSSSIDCAFFSAENIEKKRCKKKIITGKRKIDNAFALRFLNCWHNKCQ